MAITASNARRELFPLIKQVNDDRSPVEIITRGGDRAYLVAADDFESMTETDYLLHAPANARRLLESVANVRRRQHLTVKTMEELSALVDENGPQ